MAESANPATPGGAPPTGASRSRLVILVVVAVLIVAGLGVAVVVLLSAPPAVVVTLDRVDVSATSNRFDQRGETTLTARAVDTLGVDQTANASIEWTVAQPSRVQLTGTGRQVAVTGIEAGTVRITAAASWSNVSRSGNVTLTIDPLSLDVTPSDSSPVTGTPISLRVRVLRIDSSVVTGYRGTVRFTSDDALASLPGDTTFTATDAGDRTFDNVVLRKSGTVHITVRDTFATISRAITVTPERPPSAPAAEFSATRTRMHVDVDATATTDPDNDIASYAWDWGDGATSGPDIALDVASHDYTTPGRYTIALTVTDNATNFDLASRRVSVATSTVDFDSWDFFNVPYPDYWDVRQLLYAELPINAECFNATSIADGICEATDPDVDDVASHPYTHFYSGTSPTLPDFDPFVYAPYRMSVRGDEIAGYNRSEPVFLPVLNYAAAPGNRLDFTWTMDYMNNSHALDIGTACGTNLVFGNDGYILDNRIRLEMDLQQSRRMFGVVATTPLEAASWWAANADPSCFRRNATEVALKDWFISMGGSQATPGKYDIYNGYEWYYQEFATNINATVDLLTGDTTLEIIHLAYGTEVLMGRWFYWGNVSYLSNYLDSTKRAGWWGMETSWFEDYAFTGSLGAGTLDFDIQTVMQYVFSLVCTPGLNGQYDRVDDVPIWQWAPYLIDYVNDFSPRHLVSELDRYPGRTLLKCTPGAPNSAYGAQAEFDITPITWDPRAGETWRFRFPSGNVMFYDPNNTPAGTHPKSGDYVELVRPLALDSTKPAGFGDWDATSMVLEVYGPVVTGGPDGSPGADGTPGTTDDRYALESWPIVNFAPGPAALAASVGSSPDSTTAAGDSTGMLAAATSATWSPRALVGRPGGTKEQISADAFE